MKLVIEVEGMDSGWSTKDGRKNRWVRLMGRNSKGVRCRSVAWGSVAERLEADLGRMMLPGEEISSRSFMVDMTGEWRDGKPFEKNGQMVTVRSFYIDTFDILKGPVLELAKVRRDAAKSLNDAEEHRKNGRLDLAYRAVAEMASRVSGRPLDLSGLEEAFAADDAEFGIASADAVDPEAAAAAHFASVDSVSDRMEIASGATVDAPAQSASAEEASEEEENIQISDEAVSEEEDIQASEEESSTAADAPADDVLEDLSAGSSAPVASAPAKAPAAPARPAPAAAPRPVAPKFGIPRPFRGPGM